MASCQGQAARASMDKKTPKKNRHSERVTGEGGGHAYVDQKDDETHLPQAGGTSGGVSCYRGWWWGRCRKASLDM